MKNWALMVPLLVLAQPAQAQTAQEVASAALTEAPVWDGHNDVPEQLRERFKDILADFDFTDTTSVGTAGDAANPPMQTDLQRLHQGMVGAQFWSVYVSANLPEPQAVQATLEQIDVAKRLIAKYPDDMALALTADQVQAAMKQGKIASLIGMEGGHSIGSSLAVLRQTYALGARYMTLTHSKNTPWADSSTDAPAHNGLTDFGRKVVQEMNRLGMLVDLSHVSEMTMQDVLDVAAAPVIFSHSGARGIDGHPRNVPDSVLRRLPGNGGIVMVVSYPTFVKETVRQYLADRAGEKARLASLYPGAPDQVTEGLGKWDRAHPVPAATLADMADHIDRIRTISGIDHIGIGGDFDGIETTLEGMKDVSGYPALFTELARRGYSKADLEKISSGNMFRVMRAAEAYAASQTSKPPIETPAAD